MHPLLGEFECKLDGKGRFLLPAGLRRQMPPEGEDCFVVNRGFEPCLVLYPKPQWERVVARINQLNPYVKRNRAFIRYFFRGASEMRLDNAQRLLLPKILLEYAGLQHDIVLFAHTNKVEIWDAGRYQALFEESEDSFADLAEAVMGDLDLSDASPQSTTLHDA
jgi:MraZ protein